MCWFVSRVATSGHCLSRRGYEICAKLHHTTSHVDSYKVRDEGRVADVTVHTRLHIAIESTACSKPPRAPSVGSAVWECSGYVGKAQIYVPIPYSYAAVQVALSP